MTPFAKYHGAGNDFILLDDWRCQFPRERAALIRRMCDRRRGVGSDGLILIRPSSRAQARMEFFNPDGRPAVLCGNGLRCCAHFLVVLGRAQAKMEIEIGEEILSAEVLHDNQVMVHLGPYTVGSVPTTCEERVFYTATVGVPHAVTFVSSVDLPEFAQFSPKVRSSPLWGDEGANVSVAEFLNPTTLRLRTYERGVEGETLACGTAAAAAALIAHHHHGSSTAVTVIPSSGESLQIAIHPGHIQLHGRVTPVFTGIMEDLTS